MKWVSPTGMDPRFLFTFLDEDNGGALHEREFKLLNGFNLDAARGGIKRVKE